MAKFAIMLGNVVDNVVVADEALESGWIELEDDSPVQIGDIFVGGDFEKPPIDYEMVRNRNREVRNLFLSQSDWTQLPDVELPPEKKAEFAAYRQALRAVDLENPIWPEMPKEKDEIVEEAADEAAPE